MIFRDQENEDVSTIYLKTNLRSSSLRLLPHLFFITIFRLLLFPPSSTSFYHHPLLLFQPFLHALFLLLLLFFPPLSTIPLPPPLPLLSTIPHRNSRTVET